MSNINLLFFVMALLLFASVIASRISARIGMPLLLAFLGVGMLAGEEGIGHIAFNNFGSANFVSQLALTIILLDGGLRTHLKVFRIALKPATVLASWGVFASVGLLGAFATYWMGIDWKLGVLIAAIVGSTDAAAVFSSLRNSGVRLNERIQATLELESGLNDPVAILLVSVMMELITQPAKMTFGVAVWDLIRDLGLGVLFGVVAGKMLAWLLARIRLAEGLYALLVASGGLLVFALCNLVHGSGFLAVYLAGVMIGNRRNRSTEYVLNVMDGLAWLAQAAMFLVLGLLVTPSRLVEHGLAALAIAAFLILVARPIAVFSSISWFKYSKRELAYISWVGLRGAVPVTLAMMPLMHGIAHARLLFDVAFAVVILSLLIQGTTIPVVARILKVILPPKPEPLDSRELWLAKKLPVIMQSFEVAAGSAAENSHPYAMARAAQFSGSRLFALVRDGKTQNVNMATQMQTGDIVWYVMPQEELGEAFAEQFSDIQTDEREFYGEFEVNPNALAGELADAYGLTIDAADKNKTLEALFRDRFGNIAVAGDRIDIDGFQITVKELDDNSYIKSLGLKIPKRHTG